MIERFMALFAGLDRAHGAYNIDNATRSAKGKVQGKAWTVTNSVTPDLWQAHLDGVSGLGIAPLRDDDNLLFAAIDVDIYDTEYSYDSLAEKAKDLPIVWCETKSGGRHAYFFFEGPIKAAMCDRN